MAFSRRRGTVRSTPARPSELCLAPFGSLYLDPHGDVRSCCMNSWQRLGNVTEARLADIWTGAAAQELRDALAAGRLDRGCELCARHVEAGHPELAFARVFDDLALDDPQLRWPEQLELALSNACNLQCEMCNGELSSAIRIHREHRPALPEVYDDAFFADLDAFLPHLRSVTFLGGEPFLARESLRVMERLVELGLRPRCHATTNGTVWNDRIERLVTTLPMHVAISVDGATAATTESIRIGLDHQRQGEHIDRFRAATATTGAGCSLAFCLMVTNWHELGATLLRADQLDLDVFVNQVDSPARFSLRGLDDRALAEIIDSLQAEDQERRHQLGRNLGVWQRELAGLAALLEQRSPTATPVSIRPRLDLPPAVVVHADGSQMITQVVVAPDAARDLHALAGLAGRPLRDAQDLLTRLLGAPTGTDAWREGDGSELRTLTFATDHGPARTVAARRTMEPDGREHWELIDLGPATSTVVRP